MQYAWTYKMQNNIFLRRKFKLFKCQKTGKQNNLDESMVNGNSPWVNQHPEFQNGLLIGKRHTKGIKRLGTQIVYVMDCHGKNKVVVLIIL